VRRPSNQRVARGEQTRKIRALLFSESRRENVREETHQRNSQIRRSTMNFLEKGEGAASGARLLGLSCEEKGVKREKKRHH